MCGIFGSFTPGRPLDPELCRRQTDSLAHRGPDGAGYLWASSRSGEVFLNSEPDSPKLPGPNGWDYFLGHRRLAVLDLSPQAAQPMSDPCGRYWIVFNGEIYNFLELRRELEGQGAVFRTDHSDTETLLLAYIRWGAACLPRLRGMFAFAVLDLKEHTLFLARDRVGKKPLYYHAGPAGLSFASELKALLADPQTPRNLNPAALGQYLAYGYIPAANTVYQGIAKFPPGHFAEISLKTPHRVVPRRYWDLPEVEPAAAGKDWQEEFLAELTEAVRLRLVSDVPLGAFASGGLDSTLIISLMRRVCPGPVRTFTLGFAESGNSELPWARQVARRYGTEHHEEIVRPDALALLPALVRRGVEVHLLTPLHASGEALERAGNLVVHRVPKPFSAYPDLYTEVVQANVPLARAGEEIVQRYGPFDLLHNHDWLTSFAARSLKHQYKLPLLATIHATERGRGRGHLQGEQAQRINDAEWWLTYEAWRVICCARYMAHEVMDYFGSPADKVDVIPNGVDPTPFQTLEKEDLTAFRARWAYSEEKIVLYVGRLVYEKGVEVLVRAAPLVLAQVPQAKFVIAGKGPELERLRQLVGELDLASKVLLVGFIDDDTRNRLYRVADVAVFPSLYEPFGIVALEAMAARTPVVVSEVGGLKEVVRHAETGITIYPNDVASCAWVI